MNLYAPTARFDTGHALDNDALRKLAPSIFATTKHESRSERFKPIPTIDVLDGLRKEGFYPVAAKQQVARSEDRKLFTKHLIRLRRFDNVRAYQVRDTVCEIILKNANDGSSAYDLMAGLFKIQCLNSLVAQIGTVDSVKVRHSGDVVSKVVEGTHSVLGTAKLALEAPVQWSQLQMDTDERKVFAEAAHMYRFGTAESDDAERREHPIAPSLLLEARRTEDTGRDLWTTFNVVQENTLRGGLHGETRDANNRRRRVTTRPINGIDQDVKLNRALWILAEGMAKLKKGGSALA